MKVVVKMLRVASELMKINDENRNMNNLDEKKCNVCSEEIKARNPYFGYLAIQDQKLENFITQKKGKKHQENYYILCSFCQENYKIFQLKSKREELRKTRCDSCQEFLLKEREMATLY